MPPISATHLKHSINAVHESQQELRIRIAEALHALQKQQRRIDQLEATLKLERLQSQLDRLEAHAIQDRQQGRLDRLEAKVEGLLEMRRGVGPGTTMERDISLAGFPGVIEQSMPHARTAPNAASEDAMFKSKTPGQHVENVKGKEQQRMAFNEALDAGELPSARTNTSSVSSPSKAAISRNENTSPVPSSLSTEVRRRPSFDKQQRPKFDIQPDWGPKAWMILQDLQDQREIRVKLEELKQIGGDENILGPIIKGQSPR